MPSTIPITVGSIFERLTVISFLDRVGRSGKTRKVCQCKCTCGNSTIVDPANLRTGNTKSCGCYRSEETSARLRMYTPQQLAIKHIWNGMNARCNNPNNSCYHLYGGRGIRVCDRWADFMTFYKDFGQFRPSKKHSIDRIDVNGNYCPANCRWATAKAQSVNTRRNRMITFRNETLCISDWAAKLGFSHAAIDNRLRRGWSIEKALTTPTLRPNMVVRKTHPFIPVTA